MSWEYNLPKSASNKASKSGKGFIFIYIRIIKYLNIVDQLFEYPNIFVGDNFNIRLRNIQYSEENIWIFDYSNILANEAFPLFEALFEAALGRLWSQVEL